MPKTLYNLLNPTKTRLSDLLKGTEGMSEDDGEELITPEVNEANRTMVAEEWNLGPEKASVDPKANGPYWRKMAKLWMVEEAQARRRFCSNCEYYDNTPERLAECEAVPLDKYDMDGGGRGFCVKFDFVCHSLRVCQAWECKPFENPDMEGED